MKVGVSAYSYHGPWSRGEMSLRDIVFDVKRAGAEGVELLDYQFQQPEQGREEALAALREAGLPCPIFSVGPNFAKPDGDERLLELRKVESGVEEARELGAEVVRVFAGDLSEGMDFDEAYEWIVEGLSAAADNARSKGVRLALENHGRLAGRSEQVRRILDDVRRRCGHDALGANPDTGNFLLVGQPSHEALGELAPFASMVHFKDFARAEPGHTGHAYESTEGGRYIGTAIGEGEVDLAACLGALRESGFDGWLSIEYEGVEDPRTAVPRSIRNARALL